MAYNNNYSRDNVQRSNGNNQNGYGAGNGRNSYNGGGGYQQQRQVKKHSGARLYPGKDGRKPFISAWKYSKAGMLSVTANYWKDAPSENYEWECWVVNILNRNTGQKSTHTALYNPKKGTLRISELNWVINPSAPNGGYCGMAFSKEFKAGRR